MKFHSTLELLEEIRQGRMVILVDDEDRENEGDLVLAADHVTAQAVNFMAKEARGLICLAMSADQVERLDLPMMVREDLNRTPHYTAFTVSIEASEGVGTGISAADRAKTIFVASRPTASAADVRSPGHVFPLKAKKGGVLKRAGHTEGSVDLASLAGLNPSAVICEILNDDGTMARVPDLWEFANRHGLKMGSIVDLIEHRLQFENHVVETFSETLPTRFGDFHVRIFKNLLDQSEHLVFQKGKIRKDKPTLVRVQIVDELRELMAGVAGTSSRIEKSLMKIASEDGVFVGLAPAEEISGKDRLSGLLKAKNSQRSTVEMDHRNYGLGAQILRSLGIERMRFLSDSDPRPRIGLKAFGLEIVEWVTFEDEKTSEDEMSFEDVKTTALFQEGLRESIRREADL